MTRGVYLNWIQKTPTKKQAILIDNRHPKKNTPEHFYANELDGRSTLLERAIARGLVKEEENEHSSSNAPTT